MGGSGGRGPFTSDRRPEVLAKLVRKSQIATTDSAFEAGLSSMLTQLLGGYNDRDVKLVAERLDDVKLALEDSIEGSIDQMFGGSVAKHTYVDGLSDIDSLLLINDPEVESDLPNDILRWMTRILEQRFSDRASVDHGKMAVTVDFKDGMKIQLLPALRSADGRVTVPSSRIEGWSHIDPERFQEALTRRNDECGGKLVPVIKLAKAINGTFPETQRLSGYHMESIGIAAFRGYDDVKTTSAMLPVFFERGKDLILKPIHDRTGQSVHVDDYLGDANSASRLTASHLFDRISKRMRNAVGSRSMTQWRALFGLEDE
jgi:Second Messenger Oligonucleotide or Dinucleotide Synthetase domain